MSTDSLGNGKGGKSYEDRVLANTVRVLTLTKIKTILEEENPKDVELYKAVLLKLAGNVLPRLNEHTGRDGETLPVPILGYVIQSPNGNDERGAIRETKAL